MEYTRFNSLVTCSNSLINCNGVAHLRCSKCKVCYYCCEGCQVIDFVDKHKYLCSSLTVYNDSVCKYLEGKNNAISTLISKLKSIDLTAEMKELFKKRSCWFEITVPLECKETVKDTLEEMKKMKPFVRLGRLKSCNITSKEVKSDLITSEDVCDKVWFEPALSKDFAFPDICIIVRVAGIIQLPLELVLKFVANIDSKFGRSLGFLVK
jgi:hypothetical protein